METPTLPAPARKPYTYSEPVRQRLATRKAHYQNRDETFRHFYENGSTLQEIGDAFGVSRERVRQCLARIGCGERPHSPLCPRRALEVSRRASGQSEAAQQLGVASRTLRQCLDALGVLPALTRLWRWRRGQRAATISNEELLARLAALARQLGRTPTQREVKQHTGRDPQYYYNRFGSFTAACERLGLTPRPIGEPGKLRQRSARRRTTAPSSQ